MLGVMLQIETQFCKDIRFSFCNRDVLETICSSNSLLSFNCFPFICKTDGFKRVSDCAHKELWHLYKHMQRNYNVANNV